ncbi:MAG: hypothetical protein RR387_05325, partial [Clostridiales bacterium]
GVELRLQQAQRRTERLAACVTAQRAAEARLIGIAKELQIRVTARDQAALEAERSRTELNACRRDLPFPDQQTAAAVLRDKQTRYRLLLDEIERSQKAYQTHKEEI